MQKRSYELLETWLLPRFFWVRDFKFWLLAYFKFSLTVQSFSKIEQHWYYTFLVDYKIKKHFSLLLTENSIIICTQYNPCVAYVAAAFLPSLPRDSFMMYSRHFKELTTLVTFGCLGSFGLVKNCMQNSILHSG